MLTQICSSFYSWPVDIIENISDFLDDPNEIIALRELYAQVVLGKDGDNLRQFIEERTYWHRYFCRMFSNVNLPSSLDKLCETACNLATRFFGFRPAYGLTQYVPIDMTQCIQGEFYRRLEELFSLGYEQSLMRSPLMSTSLHRSRVPIDDLIQLFDVGIKKTHQWPALRAFLCRYHKELEEHPVLQCHVAHLNDPYLCDLFLGDKPAAPDALIKAIFLDSAEALVRLSEQPGNLQQFDINKALYMATLSQSTKAAALLISWGADAAIAKRVQQAEPPSEETKASSAKSDETQGIEISIPGEQANWKDAFHLLFSKDVSMLEKPMHRYTNLVEQFSQLTIRFYGQNLFHIHRDDELYSLFKEALDSGYEQFFTYNTDELRKHEMDIHKLKTLAQYGVRLPHRHAACRAFLNAYQDRLLASEKIVYDQTLYGHSLRKRQLGMQSWSVILGDMDLLAISCERQGCVDIRAVQQAVQINQIAACTFFLEEKAVSPNQILPGNIYLLQAAALQGAYDIVALLIQKRAWINIGKNSRRGTPLHLTSHVGIARLLLEKGADLNAVDACYQTPLHVAAQSNNLEVFYLFLETHKLSISIEGEPAAKRRKLSHRAKSEL